MTTTHRGSTGHQGVSSPHPLSAPSTTRSGGMWDKHPVWVVIGAVTIPNKLPCVLRRGFIRKNFRINPLQRGLVGKFAFYRHLSRKKVRLNHCGSSTANGGLRTIVQSGA